VHSAFKKNIKLSICVRIISNFYQIQTVYQKNKENKGARFDKFLLHMQFIMANLIINQIFADYSGIYIGLL